MSTTTIFTWGYYGWGNATPRLVEIVDAVERDRVTIPLEEKRGSAKLRCLSWGAIVAVRAGDQEMRVITGPASWQKGQWLLPVFWFFYDLDTDLSGIEREAAKLRRSWGLESRSLS